MSGQKAKRVLIVEDDVLIAMHLEYLLTSLGHDVVDQATRIETGIEAARNSDIDLAILDVNLAGTKSFPVADILRQRSIPFVFATGYGSDGLVDGYRNDPVLQKPYAKEDLERTIAQVLRSETDRLG